MFPCRRLRASLDKGADSSSRTVIVVLHHHHQQEQLATSVSVEYGYVTPD